MSRRERRLLRRKGVKKTKETDSVTKQVKEEVHKPRKQNKFLDFYEKHYKRNMWITIILLVISFGIIIGNVAMTGDFIHRGISLKGGVTVTVPYEEPINIADLETELNDQLGGIISVRALSRAGVSIGIIVDASDVDPDELVAALEGKLGNLPKISVETMGSALGESFFKQTVLAIVVAFILMAIVVFLAFKTFVPGFAVILSAFSDMVMTVAVLDLFKIKLETAGIAALLMLIGYSVDTDILLTTRVVKRTTGDVFDRVMWAIKTGLTMTITSFAAIFVGYFFTQSETLRQIMMILLIGLAFDIPNTWIQNVGILRWYMEKKSKKHAKETLKDYHGDDDKESKHDKEGKKEENVHEHKSHPEHHLEHHPEHHAHTTHKARMAHESETDKK